MILTLITSNPTVTGSPDQVNNLLDLLMKGGVIMIPIALLSIISVYLFFERYSYIKNKSAIDNGLVHSIVMELKNGHKDKALIYIQNNHSSIGRILESGLEKVGNPITEIESNIESATNLEITKMEKDTGYLGIIAGIAPMLGFIGTIAGVIKIFYDISLADNISIGIISTGLYQKMICSGTGLFVGVLAYTAYHILQMKIDRYTINLQESLIQFLKAL
ncbi:MAG: MotA/TolQ/ExbB proton channel family protein [Bacteroidales bacterium]|nr:MotA/TolQ/ExbB proton channel family protein [Bacteroidales bacterium]